MIVWTNWAGGACPVAAETKVYLRYRGEERPEVGVRITCAPAARMDWSHDGSPDDITAFGLEVGTPVGEATGI